MEKAVWLRAYVVLEPTDCCENKCHDCNTNKEMKTKTGLDLSTDVQVGKRESSLFTANRLLVTSDEIL
eukprot:39790-Hanusia_phi.AAC.3